MAATATITTTITLPHTADSVRALEQNPDWVGFGYLGTSRHTGQHRKLDAIIAGHANRVGWTTEQLFSWANSRTGRHCADQFPHHKSATEQEWLEAYAYCVQEGYFTLPEEES